MTKYRVELEVELEVLSDAKLEQHAYEMDISRHDLDLTPPSAEFVEQQIIYALTCEAADEWLFAGSDTYYRVKGAVPIRSDLLRYK